jgi:pilus assembly protein Flp/PilA
MGVWRPRQNGWVFAASSSTLYTDWDALQSKLTQGEPAMMPIRFLADESGATAIEYGLIAALIAVVIIVALTALGANISAKFQTIADSVAAAS